MKVAFISLKSLYLVGRVEAGPSLEQVGILARTEQYATIRRGKWLRLKHTANASRIVPPLNRRRHP